MSVSKTGISQPSFVDRSRQAAGQAACLFILLFPYIEPQIFKTPAFSAGDSVYLLFKAFSVAFAALFYVISCKPSKLVVGFGMAQLWLGLSTLVNHGSLSTWLGPACGMLIAPMLLELAFRGGRECILDLLKMIKTLLIIYYIVNVLSFFLYGQDDIAHTSFLGIDNRWIYFYLPLVIVSFVIDCMETGSIRKSSWVIWGMCFVHIAVVFSAGALVALVSIPIFLVCFKAWSHTKTWPIAGRCVFILVVIANVVIISGLLLNALSSIIVGYFHKDMTLAGRTLLWEVVLDTLDVNPLFGHGMFPTSSMQDFFYINSGFAPACRVNHPHNFALYFAMNGGWVGLLLIAASLWNALHKLDMVQDGMLKVCLLASTASIMTAGLIDSLDFSLIWLIICLVFYGDRIARTTTFEDTHNANKANFNTNLIEWR